MRTKNSLTPALRAGLALAALLSLGSDAVAAEVTQTPNLSGFTRVEANGIFEVEVRAGARYHVEIRVDDSHVNDLNVHASGDRLILELNNGFQFWKGAHVRALVTMPTLRAYHGSGATNTTITGFKATEPIDIELSGASKLDAALDAGDTRMSLSGASKVLLRGHGTGLRLDASGASRADLHEYTSANASLHLSGASQASVNTPGRIDLHASGASHVTYAGHPQLGVVDTSGASSIRSNN